MGKVNPILDGTVSNWDDGVTEYGWDDERDGSLSLYILAHRDSEYEIKREDDGEEIPLTESRYRLYDPEKISVEQHKSLKQDGYHFHEITEADLVRMLRAGFDGRSCNGRSK